MVHLLPSPRSSLLLLTLLGMSVVSSGFPLPRLRPLESSRLASPPISQDVSKLAQWEVLYPSFSLRDWSIQMMSPPEFSAPKPKAELVADDTWLPMSQSQTEALTEESELGKNWPSDSSPRAGNEEKRNIVVADDAAFRQKSKLLTAMERQKWLNSYMQKLLVVNSP
ncbi:tuberoinfundibular peptide of 39 residues [Megalops cyprinoides]|uniref:tuberoinfundibular peptide of 39 residues n=1 Tax=Megalops cyprinoides TaxID=118141 RepID=UPI001864B800|nr:tuberoinfundibular peptide of 39 residues [Megalops cyprinoides]